MDGPDGSAGTSRRAHGALKNDVIEILLHADAPVTAKQIRDGFPGPRRPALTTVMTVLERLRRAGDVDRSPGDDGELVFVAAGEESASAAHSMLDSLLRSRDRTGALLSFAGSLDEQDLAVLRTALREPRGSGA